MSPPTIFSQFDEAVGAPGQNFRPKANQRGMAILLNYQAEGWDPERQVKSLAEKAPRILPRAVTILPDHSALRISKAVQALIDHRHELQSLEGISLYLTSMYFPADREDFMARLLEAYPGLRVFAMNIGDWDRQFPSVDELPPLRHIGLETLLFSSIRGARGIVERLTNCVLPSLRKLEIELWGQDPRAIFLLRDLLGANFPQLRHLGFYKSEDQDYVAAAVVESPMLKQLEVLDLSWGWLTDDGAKALLASREIGGLKKLVLHQHFISPEFIQRLGELPLELEASAVDPEHKEWQSVRSHRIRRRIAAKVRGELRVYVNCLPSEEVTVLNEVAIPGRVRFYHINYNDEDDYSGVFENPTWLQIACEANRLLLKFGERGHVCLDEVIVEDELDPDSLDLQRVCLSFSG